MKIKFNRLKLVLLFPALIVLAACAHVQQSQNTHSGRPDVTISHADLSAVKGVLANNALNWGYYVKSSSEYSSVFEKRDESMAGAILFGSRYDSAPVWRITFNYAPLNGGVRVVANIHAVTNPGSAFERITDFSTDSKDASSIQAMLVKIRENFDNKEIVSSRGKVGVGLDEKFFVIAVLKSSPAEAAGIKIGDRIVAIDSVPPASVLDALQRITGTPGTAVYLRVERIGRTEEITVVRGAP